MWRQLGGWSLFAFLNTCVAGCSLVQSEKSNVQTDPGFGCRELWQPAKESNAQTKRARQLGVQPVATLDVFLVNEQGRVPKIDPQELKPGQHVQLLTGENLSGDFLDEVEMFTRSFAGRVKANDGERLVLQDVMMINEARSMTGAPIFRSKLPYFNRFFKNTSVAPQGVSIPGEVALDRSKILHASELTDARFKVIRQNGGQERIGVDFDFNVAENRSPTSQL